MNVQFFNFVSLMFSALDSTIHMGKIDHYAIHYYLNSITTLLVDFMSNEVFSYLSILLKLCMDR